MSMNKEVFLSILAMDSYQRGYAAGIKGVDSVKIGNAKLITRESRGVDAPAYATWQNIGFFTQEYEWNGETVISYRGTDFDAGNELVHDFVYGWSSFTGLWKASQFPLASQFYTAVTGRAYPVGNEVAAQNITTVGHSLGGALAGLVAARGKTDSYLVNPIPYGATAWGQAIGDALTATCNYVTASNFYALHKFLSISRKDRKDPKRGGGWTYGLSSFLCVQYFGLQNGVNVETAIIGV